MITRGVPSTLYCFFIASGDTGYFVWGGGGGGGGGWGGVSGDLVFYFRICVVFSFHLAY